MWSPQVNIEGHRHTGSLLIGLVDYFERHVPHVVRLPVPLDGQGCVEHIIPSLCDVMKYCPGISRSGHVAHTGGAAPHDGLPFGNSL